MPAGDFRHTSAASKRSDNRSVERSKVFINLISIVAQAGIIYIAINQVSQGCIHQRGYTPLHFLLGNAHHQAHPFPYLPRT